MEIDSGTLLVAVATFIGVIISPVVSSLMTAREMRKDREDDQRREWKDFLFDRMGQLVELQDQIGVKENTKYGAPTFQVPRIAKSVILSVNDEQMRNIAQDMPLTENNVQPYQQIDEAIYRAIARLGELISEVTRETNK